MNSKTLKIIVLIFILAVIIFGIWFFFFLDKSSQTGDESGGQVQNFFPATTTFIPDNDPENDSSQNQNPNFIPKLRQLSKVPTAGAISFNRKAPADTFFNTDSTSTPEEITETVFRYIERATGHLYETTGRTLEQTRLSNVTIPKISEAIFDKSGEKVVLRYLNIDDQTIETFLAKLVMSDENASSTPNEKSEGELVGSYLDVNISSMDSDGSDIVYIKSSTTGSGTYVSDFNNEKVQLIYESPLRNLLTQRPNASLITLTSKADSRLSGFLAFINSSTGSSRVILDKIDGLTTLTNPSGETVLLSQSTDAGLKTYIFDVDSNTFSELSSQILPEKCVWSNTESNVVYCALDSRFNIDSDYPEFWYQGLSSFEDSLWKINIENDQLTFLTDLRKDSGKSFDVVKPDLSPSDEYLIFINKNDLTLWSYDLK